MFMISFFDIPRGVLKEIEYVRLLFFLFGTMINWKKNRLAKWSVICQPKEHGGLVYRTWIYRI